MLQQEESGGVRAIKGAGAGGCVLKDSLWRRVVPGMTQIQDLGFEFESPLPPTAHIERISKLRAHGVHL